jgi:FtsH-binding integral membrane protein
MAGARTYAGASYGDQYVDKMDEITRAGFIRKVYSLLAMQLLMTVTIAAPFASGYINIENSIRMAIKHPELASFGAGFLGFLIPFSAFAVVMIPLIGWCSPRLFRNYPMNYVMLFSFTFFESILVTVSTVQFKTSVIMQALVITCGIFGGLTFYAMRTKKNYSWLGAYLNAATWGMLFLSLSVFTSRSLFGVSGSIGFADPEFLYASFGVLCSCGYIVYDTQLIVGGEHSIRYQLDDYVLAALNLYLDIIKLFFEILRIISKMQEDEKEKEKRRK